ncbi:MAG: RNA recognition motif domain-containing protein [Planctomycetota bacterium]
MATKIYVGNLSFKVGQDEITERFSAHGTVESAQVVMDRETGRSKGFAFVEMTSSAEADAAIDALDGVELDGRAMRVSVARPREDRPRGGGRSGGW